MLRALTNEIATLNEASQHLKQLKLGQIELLKELLNSQYHQGKNNQINTFLNGKDSYNLDRMVVYAEHLSKARTDATNILVTTNTTLQLKRHILDQQKQKQTVLLNTLKTNITTLEKRQNAQHKMINAVQRKIRSNKNYLSELRSNADRLKVELDKAAEQANIKMNGLGEYKGKLHWPVKGKVLHSFGSAQTGELHWNGMVVAAEKGTTVNATHDGIVVLSNWLRGYGLMLVIDHGKGDMSFYGYNQALLKNIGETVKAGDPIALIGNSGGQTNMGLYFEIRRQGNATNPSLWLVQ
ncbi:peptidoglycan DD-metalloendopeptidase family protein [Candidatus Enterovibrio altilux]|uniref:Periplasmic septal ring factor with murein hydrolase activity EnvC/YibP n=1 Tax=Candidatus Enterovibrio altilux TaxID=1927128 RepID=A0A291B8A9_9GAMM|nr:peptidoglycan DD-metalloendopeptidase family protein [Candidatus Enterovibrio luxaltus]ATF09232.1 Periplasmic septal ring factor with murein hydrolase activity EnvC/YibP [Candidatus Enterovibrio luxaltus]